jgi:hypothetical protein
MLVVVVAAMQVYAVRKTNELLRIGADDYTHCTLAGAYPHQADKKEMTLGLGLFGPILQPVLDQAAGDEVVAAHQCTVNDRTYFQIVLQRGRTLISVALTKRADTDAFPRAPMADTIKASGVTVHQGEVNGYAVGAAKRREHRTGGAPCPRASQVYAGLTPCVLHSGHFTKGRSERAVFGQRRHLHQIPVCGG